jgi:DNA-directed RNA polymerase subunit M/transcription elongation factor TFIIS
MEHALRDAARRKFAAFLGPLTGPTVRNAERSVYNWSVQQTKQMNDEPSWDNRMFRWRYKHKLCHLVAELGRDERIVVALEVQGDHVNFSWKMQPQLATRLLRKELETKNLARYSPEVLWPSGPCAQAAYTLKTRDLIYEAAKALAEDYEGLFKCGKCKSTKTTYYQMQTRSADEPMVRPFTRLLSFIKLVLTQLPYRLLSSLAPTAATAGSAECN